MAEYPPIPFRNAMSGPAGEYSDAYKAIVDQYRNDVESATELRNFQRDQQAVEAGLPPPSLVAMRTSMRPTRPQYLKSGQDWYQIGANGQPQLVVDAPEVQRPSRIISPDALPGMEIPRGYQPVPYGTSGYTLERTPRPTMEETLQALVGGGTNAPAMPALNPSSALVPPTTATATAPAYRPAPMMAPGEVAPAGSLVMGRRNTLDAPPSTTQAAEVIRTLKNGRKAVFDANTKEFLRYAQ